VILVIWHHLFQDYQDDSLPRYLLPIKFFFVEYGARGVQIFFCLSGFIIFSMNANKNKQFAFWSFMRSRYTRLLPGIILLGLISIPVLGLRKWVFSVFPSVTLIDPSIFNKIGRSENFSWFSNPMWSLFTEIRFYVIFAFVFWLLKRKSSFFRLIVLISILVISQVLTLSTEDKFLDTLCQLLFITEDSSYFILGMMLAFIDSRRSYPLSREHFAGILVAILLLIFLEIQTSFDESMKFALLAPSLTLLVLWKVEYPIVGKLAKYIGIPSYISYLTHLHFIFILRLIGLEQIALIELVLIPVIIFVLSYVINLKIEGPVIKFLRSKF